MTSPHNRAVSQADPSLGMEPFDSHNQQLISHVHPSDWQNPEPKDQYHLVIIGAGTAGLVTAIVAAGLGARVALVERHLMGGDCLNVGCVPSKGVISAARVWNDRPRRVFGAPPANAPGDFAAAMERMRRLRAEISHVDSARRFQDSGVDVFLGHGQFIGKDSVEVEGARLRFKKAVIATGARAAAPPIPGLSEVEYLTNETLFNLTELPQSLIVIGAGPIGCEMAQSFAQLGSQVTVIEMAEQILGKEDPDAAQVVQRAMSADGVHFELNAAVRAVTKHEEQTVVSFERDGESRQVSGQRLLVAVGRAPNLENLGLDVVGVETDRDGVLVDDRLRTTNRRIFAAGDVTPHYKFTHLADAHAAMVIQNALFFGRAKASNLVVPWCTYTSPEVAHVGLYRHDAERQGVAIDTIRIPFDDVDRALLDGESEGFLEIVLERGSDRILGATMVAAHAGDMIGALALAVTHEIGLSKFASTIFPYPTQGEVIKKAANAWRKKKLSPFVAKLLRLFFRFR